MIVRRMVIAAVLGLMTGCSSAPDGKGGPAKKTADLAASGPDGGSKGAAPEAVEREDGVFRNGNTADERRYMEAGKPFILAVAKNDPAAAYDCLSSHASAQMRMLQFKVSMDEAERAKLAGLVYSDVSAAKFAELFREVVKQYGEPVKVNLLYCFQTDPQVLAGTGEPLDTMFAIGAMPQTVPVAIRRASLRGQVTVKWKPEELAKEAASTGRTEKEILDDADQPYFNLKFVLVEEQGRLKVGYFEFMPPSIMD